MTGIWDGLWSWWIYECDQRWLQATAKLTTLPQPLITGSSSDQFCRWKTCSSSMCHCSNRNQWFSQWSMVHDVIYTQILGLGHISVILISSTLLFILIFFFLLYSFACFPLQFSCIAEEIPPSDRSHCELCYDSIHPFVTRHSYWLLNILAVWGVCWDTFRQSILKHQSPSLGQNGRQERGEVETELQWTHIHTPQVQPTIHYACQSKPCTSSAKQMHQRKKEKHLRCCKTCKSSTSQNVWILSGSFRVFHAVYYGNQLINLYI